MDDRRRRFEAQILPHLDAAWRLARWLLRSREGADDIVQDAVVRAYRGFDALRNADAKGWFLTIVRNCCLSTGKKTARQAWVPLPDEDDAQPGEQFVAAADPELAAMQGEESRALRSLIDALPEEFREVILLREFEDMDYRQIATVTNAPLGTVMSRLARARAQLRKSWLRQGGELRAVP
jgi:RNA polymerase sigma-70 factor (ECF subfamily)